MGVDCISSYFSTFLRGNWALAFKAMTRISSYAIYQCPDCKLEHILPNYASISVTIAIDSNVPDDDLRICFGCGAVKHFKHFIHVGTKQKPRPDFTPFYMKFIKRLLGLRHSELEPHPIIIYPYLNPKAIYKYR